MRCFRAVWGPSSFADKLWYTYSVGARAEDGSHSVRSRSCETGEIPCFTAQKQVTIVWRHLQRNSFCSHIPKLHLMIDSGWEAHISAVLKFPRFWWCPARARKPPLGAGGANSKQVLCEQESSTKMGQREAHCRDGWCEEQACSRDWRNSMGSYSLLRVFFFPGLKNNNMGGGAEMKIALNCTK